MTVVSCGDKSDRVEEINEPRVGCAGKLGSEGDGSLASGELEELLTKEGSMEMFPLLAFFQARLFVRAWPAAVADPAPGTVPIGTPPKEFRIFPDDADIEGRVLCPFARELTAAITFCASGPSYGRKQTGVSDVGEMN